MMLASAPMHGLIPHAAPSACWMPEPGVAPGACWAPEPGAAAPEKGAPAAGAPIAAAPIAGAPIAGAPAAGGMPTPAETDALAWAEIEEGAQRRRNAGARALAAFLRDVAHAYSTAKGAPETNIIDQGERKTYAMPRDVVGRLHALLEAARLEGSAVHFSQRQGTPAAPRAGLMVDFDVYTTARGAALETRHYHRVTSAIFGRLLRDVDFAAQLPPAGGRPPAELRTHIFYLARPEAALVPGRAEAGAQVYKYGFHVLVPGVKLPRGYKKYLLRALREDASVLSVLRDLGAVGDPADAVDLNSASVPVLFLGSCKRGGTPHGLAAAFEVALDLAGGGEFAPPPVIRALPEGELQGLNLVAELDLELEAEYERRPGAPARAPLVRKAEFECRPELAERVRDLEARSRDGLLAPETLLLAESALSTLTVHDPDARLLHALLDLLAPEFYSDRNRWRDVVYALANTSETYRPLAEWFSQKCPGKFAGGGAAALDELWADAVARARAGAAPAPLTRRSIVYWAKQSNPARAAEVLERSYFTTLTKFVYDYGGGLEHNMVAQVLHEMLGNKFVVDFGPSPSGRGCDYCWYEFVVPGDPMRPGEVWKWRREPQPDTIQVYMSDQFGRVLDQISEHLEERRAAAADEDKARYYKDVARAFAGSRRRLHNDTFKNGVVRQAHYRFRRRGFTEALDADPHILGVADGVLRLGPACELLARFHEFPVSRYTRVRYKAFDPDDPYTAIILRAIADIIPEPDARLWIMFFVAQTLDGNPKEGVALLWRGAGQNGKTAFLKWVARALGRDYAKKLNIQLLACGREDADRPNSAVMALKGARFGYFEESNKAEVLNVARLKELVNPGEISSRELNARQEVFNLTCNLVAASQYSFVIETTDHGTWRRIRQYESKVRFRVNPDPANPLEKADDQRFVREYPEDPEFQASMLSILVYFYERLQREYRGEIKRIYAPTIDRETLEFRVQQDALHRFISERIVVSPAHPQEYTLPVVSSFFIDWYTKNIDRKRHVAGEIIKELENSAVGQFLKPAPNHTMVLVGCRVITEDALALAAGEELIATHEARVRHALSAADIGAPPPPARARWWEPPPAPFVPARPAGPVLVAGLAGPAGPAGPARRDNVGPPLPAPDDDWLAADDDALFAAELARDPRVNLTAGAPVAPLTPAELDALLEAAYVAGPGAPSFGLDDLYAAAGASGAEDAAGAEDADGVEDADGGEWVEIGDAGDAAGDDAAFDDADFDDADADADADFSGAGR